MTEFKKLTALVLEIRGDVDTILQLSQRDNLDDADVNAVYATAEKARQAVANTTSRLQRLVLKARETDPNRQIYNEAMCGHIEALFGEYCVEVARLVPVLLEDDEPSEAERLTQLQVAIVADPTKDILEHSTILEKVDVWHDAYLLRRAVAEEWSKRVAGDLTELVAFEGPSRDVLQVQEKQTRASLTEDMQVNKRSIVELLRTREEAKWNDEKKRRHDERTQIEAASKAALAEGLPRYLHTHLDGSTLAAFAGHLGDLCEALLAIPDNENIRKLRNSNHNLMTHFGHPCLRVPGGCGCATVVQAAEVVWHALGYRVQYTGQSVRPIHALLREDALLDVTLPCGRILSSHEYIPLGYEDYSERYLEIQEPDAASSPDAWMAWHGSLYRITGILKECSTT